MPITVTNSDINESKNVGLANYVNQQGGFNNGTKTDGDFSKPKFYAYAIELYRKAISEPEILEVNKAAARKAMGQALQDQELPGKRLEGLVDVCKDFVAKTWEPFRNKVSEIVDADIENIKELLGLPEKDLDVKVRNLKVNGFETAQNVINYLLRNIPSVFKFQEGRCIEASEYRQIAKNLLTLVNEITQFHLQLIIRFLSDLKIKLSSNQIPNYFYIDDKKPELCINQMALVDRLIDHLADTSPGTLMAMGCPAAHVKDSKDRSMVELIHGHFIEALDAISDEQLNNILQEGKIHA